MLKFNIEGLLKSLTNSTSDAWPNDLWPLITCQTQLLSLWLTHISHPPADFIHMSRSNWILGSQAELLSDTDKTDKSLYNLL